MWYIKLAIKKNIKAKVFEQGYFLLEKRLKQQDRYNEKQKKPKNGNDEGREGNET